jgi:CheY-like chemotaxis protein
MEGIMATILVIDDIPNIRKFIGINLMANGYSVMEADTAIQAMDLLRTNSPSAIILDLALPTMDGWQFLTEISGEPAMSQVPVILITATVLEELNRDPYEFKNIVNVLPKPFGPDELLQAVSQALDRTAAES